MFTSHVFTTTDVKNDKQHERTQDQSNPGTNNISRLKRNRKFKNSIPNALNKKFNISMLDGLVFACSSS